MNQTKVLIFVICCLAFVAVMKVFIPAAINYQLDAAATNVFWAKEKAHNCQQDVDAHTFTNAEIKQQAGEFCRQALSAALQAESDLAARNMPDTSEHVIESRQDQRQAHDLITCGKTSCGESGLDDQDE